MVESEEECVACSCGWRSDQSAAQPRVWGSFEWTPTPHGTGHYACPICGNEARKCKVAMLDGKE